MKNTFKIFAFILLVFSSLTAFGQKKVVSPIKPKDFDGLGFSKDIKTLVKGAHSKVDKPFVFVVRDAKTYAELQKLVEGLPEVSSIDFTKSAVVAGFAGEKPTGGFTVEVKKTNNGYGIAIISPGKEMMVTQEITTPFNVSVVPLVPLKDLLVDFANDKLQTFQVNKADFEFTGGIAGRRTQFKAGGTIKILTFGDYVSLWFDLKGKGIAQKRHLLTTASGVLKNGNFIIEIVAPGSFVEMPRTPFLAQGILKEKSLSLNFEPTPTNVADGYEGRGSLEAIKTR